MGVYAILRSDVFLSSWRHDAFAPRLEEGKGAKMAGARRPIRLSAPAMYSNQKIEMDRMARMTSLVSIETCLGPDQIPHV